MAMTVSVSDDAREGWRDFADRHGVSVTALVEAIGLGLATIDTIPPRLQQAVEEARAIDAERRSRRPDPYS